MSNCIELHNHSVTFSRDEFDIEKFAAEMESHKEHPQSPAVEDGFCWFLRRNSMIEKDSVTIRFGRGASSHTWRDFGWTLRELAKYMKKPKKHVFVVSDESDGFDSTGSLPVTFDPDPEKCKI